MPDRADLYGAYANFDDPVLDEIRKDTYGQDLGQTSWVTVEEYERLIPWLAVAPDEHVLEVGSGSGGPALFLARATGCRITGIDVSESGVARASRMATDAGLGERARFRVANADEALPLDDGSVDGVVCIDAMNHFLRRLHVFREWLRVLRPGRRALFTDPVVVTGPVTNHELALRSSIGDFLFVPPGVNERLLEDAGFRLVRQENGTPNAALVSGRWHAAREARRDAVLRIEGQERFEGLQRFFETVHALTSQGRLSRFVYVVEKP